MAVALSQDLGRDVGGVRLSHAKVCQPEAAALVVEKNVFELDVAVDDAVGVEVGQAGDNLDKDLLGEGEGQPASGGGGGGAAAVGRVLRGIGPSVADGSATPWPAGAHGSDARSHGLAVVLEVF